MARGAPPAGVPPEVKFQTKPMMALALIREVLADGVSRAPVLGDEVYGVASELRRGLRELDLEYFLNAGGDLPAWTKPVKTRRARKSWDVAAGPPPALSLAALRRTIHGNQRDPAAWTAADGTKRRTRIGWLPIHAYSDLDRDSGDWHPCWLVVDRPEGDDAPYYLHLASLIQPPGPKRCLRLSRARFQIEPFFQRNKTDLGLDHHEGRSWRGFHHHLVLASVACLFVTVVYLSAKKLLVSRGNRRCTRCRCGSCG